MSTGLPRVLIVSIPKGGTNLLMQVILGIPGMVHTRRNMLSAADAQAIAPGEMAVMHLPYQEDIRELLIQNKVKILFISRDPRDIVVSMMHFIVNGFPSHVLYPAFNGSLGTNTERLSAIINGLDFQHDLTDTVLANELLVAHGFNHYPNIQEFCSPYLPWISSKHVCHVTFEELSVQSAHRTSTLQRIVSFLWDELSQLGVPKGLLVSQMEQNINPVVSPTYRAGRIGDWKNEFNERLKEDFKRVGGQMLIDLGYEQGLQW